MCVFIYTCMYLGEDVAQFSLCDMWSKRRLCPLWIDSKVRKNTIVQADCNWLDVMFSRFGGNMVCFLKIPKWPPLLI